MPHVCRSPRHHVTAALATFTLISACTTRPATKPSLQTFSTDHLYAGEARPLCKAMLDSYCTFLNSPTVQGNLEVKGSKSSTRILQGETANQFTQVFYRYAVAKIRNRESFPKDFQRTLERHAYFAKLRHFLDRHPRPEMALSERLVSEQEEFELNYLWSAAQNETVIVRMTRRYPEYHRLPEKLIPIELQLERKRVRRELISEISRAVWKNSDEWRKVERTFESLRGSFARVIDRLDVGEDIRADWQRRVNEIKLVLPGAFPAIANEECGATTNNAYYYPYLDVITVCAGDFNSEDIVQTLSHEMAHALGIDRTAYLFENHAGFGRDLSDLRRQLCEPKTFTCDQWTQFKGAFDAQLETLDTYRPQVYEFQSCLMRRPVTKTLGEADLRRFAKGIVAERISDLASNDRFLRITKATTPLRNGQLQRNPNYLNPCSYSLWSQGEEPIDDELTTLMFFTAEYRCTLEKPAAARLRDAIETTRGMSEKVTRRALKIEGRFSARPMLETEGFASPPFERFADVVGSYALAEHLARAKDRWDRQNLFLASSSWQCAEPSLTSQYPEESSVERAYIFDAHAEGDPRRKELFTSPIRRVIGCQKDFEFHECRLPTRGETE